MKQPKSLTCIFKECLTDRELRFVFPSDVAAGAWARRIVETGIAPAVDKERFIAWDRFKAITLSAERNDKRAANGAARSMFCAAFLSENAAVAKKGTALLRELIMPEYAADWNPFVSSVSRTLPALDGFFRRLEKKGTRIERDHYFLDLRLVRDRYAGFLEKNNLFEPAWDRTPFHAGDSRWMLFSPELTEDWEEYSDELLAAPEVCVVRTEDIAPPFEAPAPVKECFDGFSGKLATFPTAKEEIRAAARFIEALIEKAGLEPSEIAISVPNFADYENRLRLEFKLRDIPIDLRKGRPIPEHPAGRLFSALSLCRSSRWSYRALKDLLLDRAYPWKKKREIDALLDFGLRFRCVSGYPENGEEVDVWERSFDRLRDLAGDLRIPIKTISDLYKKLKRDIEAVMRARTFFDLRTKLIEFKSNQFDENEFSDETNRVFSRALEELAELAETEKRLTGIRLDDPYSLFLTHLKSVNYVFQAKDPGVTVYDYRVAAGIAPVVHLILNATQDSASVRADPAPFLREDRKLRVSIRERDLSTFFLHAYEKSGSFVLFTAADRGFSGYAVPHRVFAEERFKLSRPVADLAAGRPDPYESELSGAASGIATSTQARGRKITLSLERGADEPKPPLDARNAPFESQDVKQAIRGRLYDDPEDPRVSPTALNEYSSCPFAWLLKRGFGIREKETEIETVDSRELGMLYHRILERLFNRIATLDTRFRASSAARHSELLLEEIDETLAEKRREEGSFQEAIYEMYKNRITSSLEAFLVGVTNDLDGRTLIGAELELRRKYADYEISLAGKADLAFAEDSGRLSIYDFKTGDCPSPGALVPDADGALGDYQMAAYVRMLEDEKKGKVTEAKFYSIENRIFRPVLSIDEKKEGKRVLPYDRADFEPCLLAVDEAVEAAAAAVREADFPIPPAGRRAVCGGCRVSSVCRAPFDGGRDE